MKVLVTGTYCSGKSTLVSDLGNDIPRAAVVADECRLILDTLPLVDWADPDVRTYLVIRQVLIERSAGDDDGLVIVDGGLVSNLAHDRLLLPNAPDRSGLLDQLEFKQYDLALICNAKELPIRADGERYTDPIARETLDDHVRQVLSDWTLPVAEIRGNREARLRQAYEVIRDVAT